MSNIRVGIYPADEGGCGSYRVIWPWRAVGAQFADEVTVTHGDDLHPEVLIAWDGGPFKDTPTEYHTPIDIASLPDVDVMVFQRPLHKKFIEYFRLLRERGVFVVVDIDDNFERVDTRNVAWYGVEPHWLLESEVRALAARFGTVNVTRRAGANSEFLYTPAHRGAVNRHNIREALKHVDLLTVSTPALAAQYGGLAAHTVVLENCVNDDYFHIASEAPLSPVPIVGWTGSLATHPNDLQQMGGALTQLRRRDVSFMWKIVGTGLGVARACGVEPDITTNGWVSLAGEYQREYATFDIAVCPLESSAFNVAKSWLKPLEAAALGVVPVMSPLPEYERLHKKNVGVIARRPREWEGALRRLLTDEAYRVELTELGTTAARELTYTKNAHRWAEALTDAMAVRARV